MIDTLIFYMDKLHALSFSAKFNLESTQYFVLILQRLVNVDVIDSIDRILKAIGEGTRGLRTIFSVHPRTVKTLSDLQELPVNLHFIDPQPYFEFNYLVKNATTVITDSCGITEESNVMAYLV